MHRGITFIAAIALLTGLAVCAAAPAAMISVRDGEFAIDSAVDNTYDGVEDARILSGNYANKNFGARDSLALGPGTGYDERSLLRFRLEDLAGYAVADDATLTLTIAGNANTGEIVNIYGVAAANASWIEGEQDNSTAGAGEVTWNNRNHPSTAWVGGVGGGIGSGGTTVTLPLVASGTYSSGGTMTFTVASSVVQDWIDNPSDNAGLILVAGHGETDRIVFDASEEATPANRPTLTFEAVVPEPGTLALLGLGGVALLARRRRS